jgi:BirA family biotin operon repressor/biotin-[acetyl-CoA-carboxylase] ligase
MTEVNRPARLPADLGASLAPILAGVAAPIGHCVLFYPVATSTNDVAARLAEQNFGDGTIVVADQQISGRGRGGHTWYSPPGTGLYASVLVDARHETASDEWPRWLTLAAGVAAAEGLHAASGLPVSLKWPNDLVMAPAGGVRGARKVGGILAEARTDDGRLSHVIVGIGVNVRRASFPPDISSRATSLEDELGRDVERGPVLAALLQRLATWLERLRDGRTELVVDRWRRLAVGASGAAVEWHRDGERWRGVTAGIDGEGALLVKAGGATERVVAGEVIWL